MIAFIDDQRTVYGVESICRVLPIAPSTSYHRLVCQADPSKASTRHQRDTELRPEIKRVWDENYQVYGVRKAWHQLKREGYTLARCTVERLMQQIGIRGAVRGKVVKTTIPDTSAPCPRDKVNRVFRAPAPNLLWGCPLWRHWFKLNGRRLYLRVDMAGLCLCSLCYRHIR
jgi:putative transposase